MDVGWVVDSVRMRPTATRIVNSSSTAITANTTVVLYRGAVPSVCVRGPSCKPVCGRICQVMAMARHLVPIERSSTHISSGKFECYYIVDCTVSGPRSRTGNLDVGYLEKYEQWQI